MANLTICLPTRNRQSYCIQTIQAIADCDTQDFEVIVADNSDDGSVLRDFFSKTFSDPRFRLLAPRTEVLSMVDNWERTLAEAKGRWVSFIGDDDFIDPHVTSLIGRYERLHSEVDAIGWGRMSFNWPDNRPAPTLASIPTTFQTTIPVKSDLQNRLYRWSEGKRRPAAGFGIYHGAIKRSLMERIRRKYGGRHFEHPIVDYENSCKVIREARMLVHCQRPFSVLGACAASNSAGTQSQTTMTARVATFKQETAKGVQMERPDFPFSRLEKGASITMSIASTTWWFSKTYGIDLTGFPENFARAAMHECRHLRSQEDYDLTVACFQAGFAEWDGGRWAGLFEPPPFGGIKSVNEISGVVMDTIYLSESKLKVRTPGEFYKFGEHAVAPVSNVVSGTRVFSR